VAPSSVDIFVVGGGINGAAVARDAAGRGLRVALAERHDYASATSSASSKLIHGGLRYLESLEFCLVRESLIERDLLLKQATYLVHPMRFLVPVAGGQGRPPRLVYLGLKLYDLLAGRRSLGASGRLGPEQIAELPRLRKDRLKAVFHYQDCRTDDSRLVLALLLDARERGADIANYREVMRITARLTGYRVLVAEQGRRREFEARFVVNTAGPWVNAVNRLCDKPPPELPLRLVRGSHIVLAMPSPPHEAAYTLRNEDGRVVFALPWLDGGYLVLGTTEVPQGDDASSAACSEEERDYLLSVYNRYFDQPGGAASARDVITSWSGVRALVDGGQGNLSRISRGAGFSHVSQGAGGFISVYGGKLTTHRSLAEEVMTRLGRLGAAMGPAWTRGAPLPGGALTRDQLAVLADEGPETLDLATRRRWVSTYGDRTRLLYDAIEGDPTLARMVAPGIAEAELVHAREREDARSAEDFLYRRTKLFIDQTASGRAEVEAWFAGESG